MSPKSLVLAPFFDFTKKERMSSSKLFVIGNNKYWDHSLNHFVKERTLTPYPDKNILKAFSGNSYSIYTDDNYGNMCAVGSNISGSCGVGTRQILLEKITPITYFIKHGIIIKRIFINPSGYGSFFISNDNKLYACGKNNAGQLGIASNDHRIYEPVLVRDLENKYIIDIKSSYNYSIAICSDNNPKFILIITNWSRLYSLPQDIINLLISFMKTTKVFTATTYAGTGHLEDDEIVNKTGWNIVDSLKDKNFVKCAVGVDHSMLLEDNGVLWTSGLCNHGRLGLGLDHIRYNFLSKPTKIPFFLKEKINIKDIKCGSEHNIALAISGDVYSWGSNNYGECGHPMDYGTCINVPKLIEGVKEFIIDCIDCGYTHSYVKTVDKRHYLFGSNLYGECITYNDEKEIIGPFRVDEIIKSKLNATEIIKIELGHRNTKVIVSV